jgi:hypothetical protein
VTWSRFRFPPVDRVPEEVLDEPTVRIPAETVEEAMRRPVNLSVEELEAELLQHGEAGR